MPRSQRSPAPPRRATPARRFALALAIASAAALAGAAPAAAIGGGTPITIDAFSTFQDSLELYFPPGGTTASSTASGGGILGGERDLRLDLASGVTAGDTLSSHVADGSFSHFQSSTIVGMSTLTWDGADESSALDPTGLGGVNLTAGGPQDAFDLLVNYASGPVDVTMTVYSDAYSASAASITLPTEIAGPSHFVVPFSSFEATLGNPAEFANVGAVRLEVGSETAGAFVLLDSLSTDALLQAPMTAALSDDQNANGLVDPGDEIAYTTTISNPADSFEAASDEGLAFVWAPGAGSSLVAGSVTTDGTVLWGNDVDDEDVAVAFGSLADGASATVTAKAKVSAGASGSISTQAHVLAFGGLWLPTDDPGLPGTDDPTVVPVNTNAAPVAVDDAYSTTEGTALTVPAPGLLVNDTDADSIALTAPSAGPPGHGSLTASGDGSFTYTPDPGFAGTDTFTYVAHDGISSSAPGTVTITVQAACYGKAATIVGTNSAETLTGTAGNDIIAGRGGDDTLHGGGGDDTICGGSGSDTLRGGDANDRLLGNGGNDDLNGDAGTDIADYSTYTSPVVASIGDGANDGRSGESDDIHADVERVIGGSVGDTLTGNEGANRLLGGAGNDTLNGAGGNDTLQGDDGTDTLHGDAGDDTVIGNAGDDDLHGDAGTDTADYSSRSNPVSASIGGGANDGVSGEHDDVQADVERIVGGAAGDTLTGSTAANRLIGRGGDDTLQGGAGNDTLQGDTGNDNLHGGDGDDTLQGNDDDDDLNGDRGIDTADYSTRTTPVTASIGDGANDGTSGESDNINNDVERLTGGSANDTLTGNATANRLIGRTGDDALFGAAGNDTLQGDTGNDTLHGGDGTDTLIGNAGDDDLIGDAGADIADYSTRATPVTASIGDDVADGTSGEHDDIHADVERIIGGSADDTLTGNAAANILYGRYGDDTLTGNAGNDTLYGEAGKDTLDALDGPGYSDRLYCGSDDDTTIVDPGDVKAADCET